MNWTFWWIVAATLASIAAIFYAEWRFRGTKELAEIRQEEIVVAIGKSSEELANGFVKALVDEEFIKMIGTDIASVTWDKMNKKASGSEGGYAKAAGEIELEDLDGLDLPKGMKNAVRLLKKFDTGGEEPEVRSSGSGYRGFK